MTAKGLFIRTFGCQMNVYDSSRMVDILSPLGYRMVETPEEADLAILNTCHIREKATEKAYSDMGRLRDHKLARAVLGKDMMIAVAGCTAQAEGDEILRRAPYVDMVFGPQSYHRLPELLAAAARKRDENLAGPGRGVLDVEFPAESKFDFLPEIQETQGPAAFLAIQEGCDKFCHFCVVPYTRGAEYSRPAQAIYDEAVRLVGQGVREITLLGQNVNGYHGEGFDGGTWHLGTLIEKLAEIQGLERLRYTTSHPMDVDATLVAAHRDVPQLMPFLHLPVQSGSDRILKSMNRKHTVEHYLSLIEQFKTARPDIAFSSDFIVGYPGETDADFEATLDLVRTVGFAQAYSFKYSPRPGTPAAMLSGHVADEIQTERLARLQALIFEQQTAFNHAMIGRTLPVLIEKLGRHEGQVIGRSPYLQSVHLEAPTAYMGQIISVEIVGASQNSLAGRLAPCGA